MFDAHKQFDYVNNTMIHKAMLSYKLCRKYLPIKKSAGIGKYSAVLLNTIS
jgi:hypothetical protein